MKFPPRPYQVQAFHETREALKDNQRVILCMPTGAGKTVTFSDIALAAVNKGRRAMVLCDRKELIKQAYDKVTSYGLSPTVIAPKHRQYKNTSYVASVDTLVRREAPEIDLLIIDEAHKKRFDKILKNVYPDVKTIGATATPIRSWKDSLHHFYGAMVEPTTIPELIANEWLTDCRTFGAMVEDEDIKVSYNAELGENDYNTEQLYKQFNKKALYDGVVDNYLRFAAGTKAIVFNVNVEHSIKMTEEFNRRGILSYHIDGTTPDYMRKRILEDYAAGKFLVLNNCSIFTTGFDEPSIETVIVNRKTLSLALWLQMAGRGSRPYLFPDGRKKTHFNLIDQGGNIYKHGFWQQERKFSLISEKPSGNPSDLAPIKDCPQCESLLLASSMKCKFCGYVFPVKEVELVEAEFMEIHPSIIATGNSGAKNAKPNFWKMTDAELRAYGVEKGYKPGWAEIKISQRNNTHIDSSEPSFKY